MQLNEDQRLALVVGQLCEPFFDEHPILGLCCPINWIGRLGCLDRLSGPFPSPKRVVAGICCQTVEPRRECGAPLKARGLPKDGGEDLLGRVERIRAVAEHPISQAVDSRFVSEHEGLERRAVAGSREDPYQLLVRSVRIALVAHAQGL